MQPFMTQTPCSPRLPPRRVSLRRGRGPWSGPKCKKKARLIEEPLPKSMVTRLFDLAEDRLGKASGSTRALREQGYLIRITRTWPYIEKMDTDDLFRLVRRLPTTDLPRILEELEQRIKSGPALPQLVVVAFGDPMRVRTYRKVQNRQ